MRVILRITSIIYGLYFFLLANFFFWTSVLAFLVFIGQRTNFPGIFIIVNLILGPIYVYISILFFMNNKKKYKWALIFLVIHLVITELSRSYMNFKLEYTDFKNLLFFGIPFLIVLITRIIENKSFSKNVAVPEVLPNQPQTTNKTT